MVLHSLSQTIQFWSPGYPESPSHDVVCEWVIRGPLDSGLQINFQQERYASCDQKVSYIQIFNGGSDLSSEVGKYCAPPYNLNTIVVESNVAFVRFVMKERNFRAKFNATVRVDRCHREYYVGTSTRELSIPVEDYSFTSESSGEAKRCRVHLRTHPNYYITINVTYANLIGDNCTAGDVIQFQDSPTSTFLFEKFCPNTENIVGKSVTSVENQMVITYERVNLLTDSTSKSGNANRTSGLTSTGIKFRVQTKYRSKFCNCFLITTNSNVIDSSSSFFFLFLIFILFSLFFSLLPRFFTFTLGAFHLKPSLRISALIFFCFSFTILFTFFFFLSARIWLFAIVSLCEQNKLQSVNKLLTPDWHRTECCDRPTILSL